MSTTIKKIAVNNLKAISHLEADFKGCTAIIIGANNKGKSTFLRGIIDRIRGIKPELIVKQGEKEGTGTIELTTGEKFMWEFDIEGTDKLTFYTKDGDKTKVTKDIAAQFFPPSFDIDKFLNSEPRKQSAQLQKIVGLDFTEIDNRYRLAYEDRTEKNREAERFHAKLIEMFECPQVDFVSLAGLQEEKAKEKAAWDKLYLENKGYNDNIRKAWQDAKVKIDEEVRIFNKEQDIKAEKLKDVLALYENLKVFGYPDHQAIFQWIEKTFPEAEPHKKAVDLYPKEPEYIKELPDDTKMKEIDDRIFKASQINAEAQKYKEYVEYKQSVADAKEDAFRADEVVQSIYKERRAMIESAKMPKGLSFNDEGIILVDGFLLDKAQISTSKLYCAALRMASLNLGEVRTLYFDASPLDKNTLSEVEQWAEENGLQLLIERSDYEAGEIRYEIVEHHGV